MSDRSIETAVRKLAGTFKTDPVNMLLGAVKSVDQDKATCVVTIENDVDLPNVKLQSAICDGLLISPVVGSNVIVIRSKYLSPFVAQYSAVDEFYLQVKDAAVLVTNDGKIKLNDGSFKGMIKIEDLVSKLNDIENLLNEFIGIYNGHTHNVTAVGAPTAVPGALETNTLTPTQVADIENDKITHGK